MQVVPRTADASRAGSSTAGQQGATGGATEAERAAREPQVPQQQPVPRQVRHEGGEERQRQIGGGERERGGRGRERDGGRKIEREKELNTSNINTMGKVTSISGIFLSGVLITY